MRGRLLSGILSLLLITGLTACGGGVDAPPLDSTAANTGSYSLGPNDEVKVTVFGFDEFSNNYELDGSGNFPMPLVGEIQANGLTARQLEQEVRRAYVDGEIINNAEVSVEILTFRPFSILGEVNNPGRYEFQSGMTVLDAIAAAGGFTYRARQDQFLLIRDGKRWSIDPTALIGPSDNITVLERFL